MRLSQASEAWKKSRTSQRFAIKTVSNDNSRIRKLVVFTDDIDVRRIIPEHIEDFYEVLSETNNAGTVRNFHYTFKKFFAFCRGRGYMKLDHDPIAEHRPPQYAAGPRHIIALAKFEALLDAAELSHPRDRAAVALGLYTLARSSEIVPLRIRDLDLDTGDLPMFQRKTTTHDTMPITLELDTEMRKWLISYAELAGPLDPNWYLVPARVRGEGVRGADGLYRTTPETALLPRVQLSHSYLIVQRAMKRIGEPIVDPEGNSTREGMHTLRRSGARALFDELRSVGYDGAARLVQMYLHHADMAQTERYLQISPDKDKRNQMFRGNAMYPSARADTVVRLEDHRKVN